MVNLDSIKLEKLLLLITPMNWSLNARYILLALATMTSLFITSCSNFTLFGPGLYDAALSTGLEADYRPKDSTNLFYIDSPQVCCSVRFSGSHENTTVLARWIFEENEAGGSASKVVFEDTKNQVKDGYLGFILNAPPQGFSAGQYRLDLFIDSRRQSSIPFSIKSDQSGPLPQISHFYSEQHQIIAGETSKLSWSVADAGRVSIAPSPGAVASEGGIDIAPTVDTTYTLWAVNKRGSSSSQISVAVVQPVKEKADLVITDFWTQRQRPFLPY